MTVDSGEEYNLRDDCGEPEETHDKPNAQKSALRITCVLNGLQYLGIPAVCIGDGNTIVITHQLREALNTLTCDKFRSLHLVWIRRIEISRHQGLCSIEPLISSGTCGLNSRSPDLRCGLCKQCLVVASPHTHPFTGHKGFAFAGAACLATFHSELSPTSGHPRSLLIFCLSAIKQPPLYPSLHCQSEHSIFVLRTYIPGLDKLLSDGSVMRRLPDSRGRRNSENDNIVTHDLLRMLECVSTECLDISNEEFKAICDARVEGLEVPMYPGLMAELEAELDTHRTCSAVIAVKFGDYSDFCLYEVNFASVLNYL